MITVPEKGREAPLKLPERKPDGPIKRTPDGVVPPRGKGDDEDD